MNKAEMLAFYQAGIKKIEMIQENEFRFINNNDEEVRINILEWLNKNSRIDKLQDMIAAMQAQAAAMQAELDALTP